MSTRLQPRSSAYHDGEFYDDGEGPPPKPQPEATLQVGMRVRDRFGRIATILRLGQTIVSLHVDGVGKRIEWRKLIRIEAA